MLFRSKSLNIDCISTLPSSCMFNLILSFPLLEDLAVTIYNYVTIDEGDGSNRLPTLIQPSSPPMFTGSLKLVMIGLVPIIRRLLSLPRGIHFREFALSWDPGEDISLITALVESCSHTLESLDITCSPLGASILCLHPCWRLTFVSRKASYNRPLEDDETPGYSFSAHITERRMDHHGAPNHHA